MMQTYTLEDTEPTDVRYCNVHKNDPPNWPQGGLVAFLDGLYVPECWAASVDEGYVWTYDLNEDDRIYVDGSGMQAPSAKRYGVVEIRSTKLGIEPAGSEAIWA